LLFAQEEEKKVEFQGFLESYNGATVRDDGKILTSRSRFRLDTFYSNEKALLFGSLDAQYNDVIKEKTNVTLKEGYVLYETGKVDFKLGRQIVVWGKSDGITITDVVNPRDYTEFLTVDLDDMRLGVEAAKLRLLTEKANIELVWVPLFRPAELPLQKDNPWRPNINIPKGFGEYADEVELALSEADKFIKEDFPERNLKNSEFGARVPIFFPNFDVSLCGFYTWDDIPAAYQIKTQNILGAEIPEIELLYKRVLVLGGDLSFSLGDVVVRGEGAVYAGKHIMQVDEANVVESYNNPKFYKTNVIKSMIGFDYNSEVITLSGQFSDDFVPDFKEDMARDKQHNMLGTLLVGKKFFRDNFKVENKTYVDFGREALFNRINIDYAATDGLHFLLGFDLFHIWKKYKGEDSNQVIKLDINEVIAEYDRNDNVWIKAKYNF